MFTSSSLSSTIAIILAFLVGILLYILKFKFALKIWIAKTHVKVFNHSLALCLFVSMEEIKVLKKTTLKRLLNKAIIKKAFERLMKQAENHSKSKNLKFSDLKMQKPVGNLSFFYMKLQRQYTASTKPN